MPSTSFPTYLQSPGSYWVSYSPTSYQYDRAWASEFPNRVPNLSTHCVRVRPLTVPWPSAGDFATLQRRLPCAYLRLLGMAGVHPVRLLADYSPKSPLLRSIVRLSLTCG